MKIFKIDAAKIKLSSSKFLSLLQKHAVVIVTILGGLLALLAINSVYSAMTTDASQEAYEKELATFDDIIFDEEVIQTIVELVENDVDIRARLPNSRDNPFLDF